ncbi:MAG: PLP-dependent aminotransferase family protein [Hyphomicrobiales bacterium]
MTKWTPELSADRPRYLAIAEAMRADLLRGVLKPGDRLPTHRELAYRLGVTTGTVTRAYAEAERLGILVGEVGRGTFLKLPVHQPAPFAATESGVYDMSQASPPLIHEYQDLDRALSQIMSSASRLDLLDYTPPEGHALHRAMGAKWLARSNIEVGEEQVIVTSGAHPGLIATLASLSQPGDGIFVEGLNYPAVKPICRLLGLNIVPLEADEHGLVPEALERAARAGEARMLYIVPTLQSPTTATLPLTRRHAVVDIARRYGLTIVEDDLFRLLDPRLQPPTLFALAPERTYHVTSISKTLSPGLRVGFVVTPPGRGELLMRHQTVASGRAVGLAAEVARHWIEGDAADRILAAIIAENAARRDIARDVFRGRTFSCNPGAPFLWLKLPDHWQPGDYVRAALDLGVKVSPGPVFAMDRRADDQAIRICFGGRSDRSSFRAALVRLNALLDEVRDDRFSYVA